MTSRERTPRHGQPIRTHDGHEPVGPAGPFRYFVSLAEEPEVVALLRLDAAERLDIWASRAMAAALNAPEGWLPTGWPDIAKLLDGSEFAEIEAVEAERLRPLMNSSPTLWVQQD